ncbi:MAG TPA: hypothetical protein VFE47_15790 [Tepidisphaeraceae bacterium]|jgi:hypothetical protein|nr:hypothetical protein [Tepidisphaeraceae bacterium]
MSLLVAIVGLSTTLLLREGENNRNLMASGTQGAASASAQAAAARDALDMLNSDLKVATAIVATPAPGGGMQVALTVPGRYTGDATESILYQWNGPGTSLMRQLNNNPAASIADNLQSWNLATLTKTIGPPAPTESAEQLLSAHDGSAGGNVQPIALAQNNWPSQYLLPTLPASAVSWRITHLKLQLQAGQSPSAGAISVSVFSADAAGNPLGLLASASVDPATLPTGAQTWADIPLGNLSGLSPGHGVCVVVSTQAAMFPASVFYDPGASDPTLSYSTSADGGATWTSATAALQIQVYGTVSSQ